MEFSMLIRQRRRERGITADAVGEHLGFSRVYYSAVENSRAVLADAKLGPLVKFLGFDEPEAEKLAEVLGIARTTGWWTPYSSLVGDQLTELLGLEYGAASTRIYESRVITGLLQTRAYATEVINAAPDVSLTDAPRHLELRMRRQDRLGGPDPLKLEVVLGEAALMQQFGGPRVLRDQLQHLLATVEGSSSVHVRVQPFDITPLGLINATTVVFFDYDSPYLPTIAWQEAGEIRRVERDPEVVARLLLNYHQTLASSLDEAGSLDLIQKRIDALTSAL
jgi:transcriptional regulator with XRE-family HTH domain